MVSIVIPAFNEAATVGSCVNASLHHPSVVEVIVVDDGSSDGTGEAAMAAGAKVIRLDKNGGKAAAMDAGVRAAKHNIILFLDADVTGHTEQMLTRVVKPVIDGQFEMYVGVRARKTIWLNRLLRFFPIISGERAVTRRLWDAIPIQNREGFKIEIALNHASKQFKRGMGFELIAGTRHHIKERKYGLLMGFWMRIKMTAELVIISFRLYLLEPCLSSLRRACLKIVSLGRS
ncbi:MAG: glycosyltransferase family 2 protein [Pseudohongiella sp.]|uniref:glycosyltransferase family 2 protein n=1 Tax=Pseudohongiella sp. TaxID=1979412 RepID=UPI0034A03AF4